MDRSWMYLAPRSSEPFMSGVQNFLNFVFARSSVDGTILCPCSRCLNMFYFTRGDVFDHLVCWGFRQEYSKWVYHGEGSTASSSNRMHNEEEEGMFDHDMRGLLNDIFRPIPPVQSTNGLGVGEVEMGESDLNNAQEAETGRSKFSDILKDVEEKVQEVVLLADFRCKRCQDRVADIVSSLNGNDLNLKAVLPPILTDNSLKTVLPPIGVGPRYESCQSRLNQGTI